MAVLSHPESRDTNKLCYICNFIQNGDNYHLGQNLSILGWCPLDIYSMKGILFNYVIGSVKTELHI